MPEGQVHAIFAEEHIEQKHQRNHQMRADGGKTDAHNPQAQSGHEDGIADHLGKHHEEGEGKGHFRFAHGVFQSVVGVVEIGEGNGKGIQPHGEAHAGAQIRQGHIGIEAGKQEGQTAQGHGKAEHQGQKLPGIVTAVFPIPLAIEAAQDGRTGHRKTDAGIVDHIEGLHAVRDGAAGTKVGVVQNEPIVKGGRQCLGNEHEEGGHGQKEHGTIDPSCEDFAGSLFPTLPERNW